MSSLTTINPAALHRYEFRPDPAQTTPTGTTEQNPLHVLAAVSDGDNSSSLMRIPSELLDEDARRRMPKTLIFMPSWDESTKSLLLNIAINSLDDYKPPKPQLRRFVHPLLVSLANSTDHYRKIGGIFDEEAYAVVRQGLRGALNIAMPIDSVHSWDTRVCKDTPEWESWVQDPYTTPITSFYSLDPSRVWIGIAPIQRSSNMFESPGANSATQSHAPTCVYIPISHNYRELVTGLDDAITRLSSLPAFSWGPINPGPLEARLSKFVRAMMFTEAMSVTDRMLMQASGRFAESNNAPLSVKEHFERTWKSVRRMDEAFGRVDLEVLED